MSELIRKILITIGSTTAMTIVVCTIMLIVRVGDEKIIKPERSTQTLISVWEVGRHGARAPYLKADGFKVSKQ